MFDYLEYWKNSEFRFKFIVFIILIIISYFPLKTAYNLYFNPIYILEKYYSSMREARIKYDSYNKSYEKYHFYYYQPKEKLREYLNEMIEERRKHVLNSEKVEKLMREYYKELEKEEIILNILGSLDDEDKLYKNIKTTKYGYNVYLINPMVVGYTLNFKDDVIEKRIYEEELKKIKYPENAEIT
ncbi:hypothetical protein, partial [Marinitoga sp. 1155]|uniref:hypothetical protein n=2 Tax=unclassified Marinitoga TaxID=2640159 RepID=UPI00064142F8